MPLILLIRILFHVPRASLMFPLLNFFPKPSFLLQSKVDFLYTVKSRSFLNVPPVIKNTTNAI